MTHSTVQLFVNPSAGSASRRRVAALHRAFEAAGAGVIVTATGEGPLAVADAADHVCAVGGDGTLRYVADAVRRANRPIDMSVYPAGTVNLLARESGYPAEPASFVRHVLHGAPRRTYHVGLIDGVMMFSCASVGPDSLAVAALSPRLKQGIGRAAYLFAFLKLLVRWPRARLRVVADGRDVACEAVYIAKGRFFAGAWSFAPEAAAEQAMFHVVALHRARRRDFARFIWAMLLGQDPGRLADATSFTCAALRLEGDTALPVQADGDIVAHLPVHLTLDPDGLTFA
jgi:diacylglycerol kinase family enzyme